MMDTNYILSTEKLTTGFADNSTFTKNSLLISNSINLGLKKNALTSLLGVNGAGKSTLIRTLTGLQKPLAGSIFIREQNIRSISKKALAKLLSVVLTDPIGVKNMKVEEMVEMGRFPYTNSWGFLTREDKVKTGWAIELAEIEQLRSKKLFELSDGELQKALIARALAQDTPVLILDEPTSHLDIPNQIMVMRLLRKLTREADKTILLSTHELDLALQISDQLWLMQQDTIVTGIPEELVLDGNFEKSFQKKEKVFDINTGTFLIHQPWKEKVSVTGALPEAFWTKRALAREGYEVVPEEPNEINIQIIKAPTPQWKIQYKGESETFTSIRELISFFRIKGAANPTSKSNTKTNMPL